MTHDCQLFVYGTLRNSDLVHALTARRFAGEAAVLLDFEKIEPAGGYPYALPRHGASVDGLLLRGLDEASLTALDAYEEEGRLYRREQVVVRLPAGHTVSCFTYVGIAAAHAPA